jgi:AcrR family transcriptional regulator
VLSYLLDEGLQGLSFRKLASAVGISHVTLRHHFGSKDELVLEVFELIRDREPVPEHLPEGEPPEEVLRLLWSWWTAPENLRYLRLMYEAYGDALRQPDTYREFLQSTIPHWLDDARRMTLAAGCPADRADAFATFIVAQLRGLLLDLLTTGDQVRAEAGLALLIESLQLMSRTWPAVGQQSKQPKA